MKYKITYFSPQFHWFGGVLPQRWMFLVHGHIQLGQWTAFSLS